MATSKVEPSNGKGIASLVLGILSILFAFIFAPVGLVMAIIGLVLALKQNKEYKNGVNTGGLVTSIVGIVLGVIFTIIWILFIIALASVPMMYY